MHTDGTSARDIAPHRLATNRHSFRWYYAIPLLSGLCLVDPAWAANSGGSTDTDCGFPGDSYIGTCSTDASPATGADVRIDSPPPSADDPAIPVTSIAGGVNEGGGDAISNHVTVTGTETYDAMSFFGGIADNTVGDCTGTAAGNSVTIGGQVTLNTPNVVGGESCSGAAQGNAVIIQDQAIIDGGFIMGGQGGSTAIGNSVILRGQAAVGNGSAVLGGYAFGDATSNTVLLADRAAVDNSLIYGGLSTLGKSTGNTVTIRDQVTVGNGSVIYGGSSQTDDAVGNTVSIEGQANISAAPVITGGEAANHASGNSVIIRDQTRVENSAITGGQSNIAGNASDNTILIRDQARVENSVVTGGMAVDGDATGNRIVLQGTPVLTGSTLIGGAALSGGNTAGNTLEIHGNGIQASTVMNFEHYRYLLPHGTTPSTPVFTATDGACICNATVSVDLASGAGPFDPGTRLTLMHSDALTSNRYTDQPVYITGRQGLALRYRWGITATDNDLFATVSEVSTTEESKAPLEGRIVPLAMINQGADMIAGAAMDRARISANVGQWGGFGTIGGGRSRYASGSHVDVDGLSFILGTTRRFNTGPGSLTAGAFVELGTGHYSSTNRFSSGTARGSGKSRYYGVGLMMRHDFADPAHTDPRGTLGPYVEASLRAGRSSTDWRSNDLSRMLGTDVSYDSSVPYHGAHLGLGYVAGLGPATSADLYAKYFWSHQDGDKVTIAGDEFRFEDTDSHRLRIGTRMHYSFSEQTRAYAGAAWEHEFEGTTRASIYGNDAPAPSIKGDTGVFELGLEITPNEARALTVNLGIQAYTGKREGLGGTAMLKYAF